MSQILSDFIVQDDIGLFCRYGNFYLDPKMAVPLAVVSHAHGDHAVRGNGQVYCTRPTEAFMRYRYKKNAGDEFHIKVYGESFVLNGVQLTFFSAGHMLGSATVLMEYEDVKYLYTGDYKLEADDTCEPIEFVEADVLITETTFAKSTTIHPDPVAEIKKLNDIPSNIMLGCYALGKSQRLISLINQHCEGKTILLHRNILPLVHLYEQLGVNMGAYQPYDRKVMKHSGGGMIYMVPPMVYNNYFRAVNVVRIFASGWDNLQYQNLVKLYISDHVDWPAILKTIEAVKPTEVWTTHGDGRELQTYFQDRIAVKMLNSGRRH